MQMYLCMQMVKNKMRCEFQTTKQTGLIEIGPLIPEGLLERPLLHIRAKTRRRITRINNFPKWKFVGFIKWP